jgi:RNA-directed DNA polymerase
MREEGVFVVRYADDITIFASTRNQILEAKSRVELFLTERGLRLNEKKTEFREISEGFELLGFSIKEYPNSTKTNLKGKPGKKGIIIIKPAQTRIKRFVERIKEVVRAGENMKPGSLIATLNPIIRGWANYFNSKGG